MGYGWFTNIENEKLAFAQTDKINLRENEKLATDINQKLSLKQMDKLTISIRG